MIDGSGGLWVSQGRTVCSHRNAGGLAWNAKTCIVGGLQQFGGSMSALASRALAGFLGAFTLLNVTGRSLEPGFDATIWWLDLRPWPPGVETTILWAAALAFSGYALRPCMAPWRRGITAGVLVILLGIGLLNIVAFLRLVYRGAIDAAFPLPFSLLVLIVLGLILRHVLQTRRPVSAGRRARWARTAASGITLTCCLVGFPLALMCCFGKTDYSRPADVIVVFGARAYADGRCSDALYDRVATACTLYREGYAPLLLFSGGPGDGDIHETQAMATLARELGVPPEAIILDPHGLNTQATVVNTVELIERQGLSRVLAVSHFYHMPRVKMCYRRQGIEVFTVPARERYTLSQLPYLMAREVAAFWAYYLAPLRSR